MKPYGSGYPLNEPSQARRAEILGRKLRRPVHTPAEGRQTDDYGMPVGKGGMRRFATSAPEADGPMKGSTAGVLLGQAGYQQWKRDMATRGQQVPAWEEGTVYESRQSALVDQLLEQEKVQVDQNLPKEVKEGAVQVVDRLIEDDRDADLAGLVEGGVLVEIPNIEGGLNRYGLKEVWSNPQAWTDELLTPPTLLVGEGNSRYTVADDDAVELETDDLDEAVAMLRKLGGGKMGGGIMIPESKDSFSEWFLNNKDSDEMKEDYREYRSECKQVGDQPKSFRAWARERWQALQEGEVPSAQEGRSVPGIDRILSNLENGNLSDARAGAKRFTVGTLQAGFCEAGMSETKAKAAATYLKYPSQESFQAYCDAE